MAKNNKNEELQLPYVTRRHGRILAGIASITILALIAALWLINFIGERFVKNNYGFLTFFYVVVILSLIGYFLVYPWLKWLTTIYKFDKGVVTIEWGIFTKNKNTIPFTWVTNFYIIQSIDDRMFKSGSLILELTNGNEIRLATLPQITIVEDFMNLSIKKLD
jgi:membrane protein YdbS with pleckstrin-like domain